MPRAMHATLIGSSAAVAVALMACRPELDRPTRDVPFADAVKLDVHGYDRVTHLDGLELEPGNVYLTVDAEIANATAAPIQLRSMAYAVESADGERYRADSQAPLADCDGATVLAAGLSSRCVLTFEVPLETLTTKLIYTDVATGGREYATEFVIDPCNVCYGGCIATGALCCDPSVDLQTDDENCGTCGHACALPAEPSNLGYCISGSCLLFVSTSTQQTCTELCASGGFVCLDNSWIYCGDESFHASCDIATAPQCTEPFDHIDCACRG